MALRRVLANTYTWQVVADDGSIEYWQAERDDVVDFSAEEAARGDGLALLEAHAGPATTVGVMVSSGEGSIATDVELAAIIDGQDFTGPVGAPRLLLLDDGTAAAPALSWAADPDTGWLRSAADTLVAAVAGAAILTLAAGDITAATGITATKSTISQAAGSARQLRFQSAGVDRWLVQATSTAESGANAGSDLAFLARDDAGAAIGTALSIVRSTMAASFGGIVKIPDGTAGAPSLAFTSQPTSGIILSGNGPALVASGAVKLSAGVTALSITDGIHLGIQTTTGSKIGTVTTAKLAFYNSTPIVQPSSTTDLRQALINLGLLATGGATPLNLNGGSLTADQITGADVTINDNVTTRSLAWSTSGSQRWIMQVDSTAEGGANAGSDWKLLARTDAGGALHTVMSIVRSTGIITYSGVQLGPAGAVGAPAWSFSGDPNTGRYSLGSDVMVDVCGGAAVLTYATTGLGLADGMNLGLGTTTGTKIGGATTQKLAFYNATPIVQPTGVADPTAPGVVYSQAEAQSTRNAVVSILTKLEALGLFAAA